MLPGMKILLAVIVLLACASPAQAQLVYHCIDDNGKMSFSESTCKGKGQRSVGKRGYSARKPMREEILERWGLTEAQLLAVERKCEEADAPSCDSVATFQNRTMAQEVRRVTNDAVAACQKGKKDVCDVLAKNQRDIRKSIEACEGGRKSECELLSRLAQ